jgi:hypothetical protein
MVSNVSPLAWNVPIVDENGNPTPYFVRQLARLLAEKKNIEDDVTDIAGDIAALTLDDLTDVNLPAAAQGDLLYRNATEWVKLAAGTSGQVLKTLGTGANPAWSTATWELISSYDFAVTGATQFLNSGDLTGYTDVLVIFSGVTCVSSTWRIVQVSTNGGSSYDTTSGNYATLDTAGVVSNDSAFFSHSTAATAARSGTVLISGINLAIAARHAQTLARATASALYVGSSSVINRVRAGANTGNMNGGKVWILARR